MLIKPCQALFWYKANQFLEKWYYDTNFSIHSQAAREKFLALRKNYQDNLNIFFKE